MTASPSASAYFSGATPLHGWGLPILYVIRLAKAKARIRKTHTLLLPTVKTR